MSDFRPGSYDNGDWFWLVVILMIFPAVGLITWVIKQLAGLL